MAVLMGSAFIPLLMHASITVSIYSTNIVEYLLCTRVNTRLISWHSFHLEYQGDVHIVPNVCLG